MKKMHKVFHWSGEIQTFKIIHSLLTGTPKLPEARNKPNFEIDSMQSGTPQDKATRSKAPALK